MTPTQFESMSQARGLPDNDSRAALRAILVDRLPTADAARAVGCTYSAAYRALEKFQAWEAKVIAAGYTRE